MARYNSNNNTYTQYLTPLMAPIQVWCFIMVLLLLLGLTWYVDYESMWENVMHQMKLLLILLPVLLLLTLHFLSLSTTQDRQLSMSYPDQDTVHRAGGSSWGVALLLVFLLFMISYHTSLRDSWWPLLSN